ncbi:MAG: hypothetical protein MJY56_03085 [Bacteroidales bacterium]|nr:hypothetical protein [Bacteroidales bacterium]
MKDAFKLILAVAVAAAVFAGCSKPDNGSTSIDVPTSGGKVTVGGVTLDIPEGALEAPVKVEAKVLDELGAGLARPFDALAFVEFGPEGTRFAKSVTVTLPVKGTPVDRKLMAYYYNESEKIWTSVGEARPTAGGASFEIDHFSLYAVSGHYNYVNEWSSSLAGKVKEGLSDAEIFEQFKSRIDANIQDLFSWDITGGRYYRVTSFSEKYMYDINGKEGQGVYQIGDAVENWAGYHDSCGENLVYMSETQSMKHLDYNEFQKAMSENQEVCSSDFSRELHLVPSVLTASVSGELKKKGDTATIRFKAAAKTTGETVELKVYHSCVGFTSGYSDTTPNGSYDRIVELPYDDPTLGSNPPMAGQQLKVKASDASALKISAESVETNDEGEAVVTVTALKDNASGSVTATYDYNGGADSDHSEVTVSVGGGNDGDWHVTGILSDIRGESIFGISASVDVSFEFSFNPDKPEKVNMYGESLEVVPATFRISASNAHISPQGYYDMGVLGRGVYTISNVTCKTLTDIKGFVTVENGVACAVAYDMANPVDPVFVTYDVLTEVYSGNDLISSESETEEWGAPSQYSFPLKEGHYTNPIVLSTDNAETAMTDTKNFYVMLLSGNLIGMSEDSVLTGDIVVSAPKK